MSQVRYLLPVSWLEHALSRQMKLEGMISTGSFTV